MAPTATPLTAPTATPRWRRRRRRRWRRLSQPLRSPSTPARRRRGSTRSQPHPDAPGLDALVDDPGHVRAARSCSVGAVVAWRRRSAAAGSSRPPSCGTAPFGAACARPSFRLVRDGATLPPADDVPAGRRRPPHDRRRHPAQPGARAARRRRHRGPAGPAAQRPHLGRVANNLALDLDHAVQVNAYLSPAAAQGPRAALRLPRRVRAAARRRASAGGCGSRWSAPASPCARGPP